MSFFGQSISEIQASHFPTVPFGGVRLWDTNTTWGQIETSSGSYSWIELDTWLRSMSSHGKDSMYTFGRVPHWASMRPSEACPYDAASLGCAAPPADVDSGDNRWKTFVTALVRHSLSSPELHIAYYEMWNEPDLKRNWTGTPAQLVTMAKDAYAIIHSLDPKAKLVGPTASTANQYGVHYLPDYYAAGGANAQDIVGLHAYLYTGSSFSTTPAAITTSIGQLKALMLKYNISSKPIWFTEGNWNGDGLGSLTDAQKAAYLAQEYMLMWSTDAVSRYYWYSWDSKVGTLWTASKGLTPAGTAYDQLADWLIGSTHTSKACEEASDGTWTCTLTLSTGYPAEIIWNPGVSKTITVGAAFATSRTLTNSTVHSIAGHQVAIGALPVLIIESQATQ
jgi:polysaccharide biosynthesis protein PslG